MPSASSLSEHSALTSGLSWGVLNKSIDKMSSRFQDIVKKHLTISKYQVALWVTNANLPLGWVAPQLQ